MLFALPKTENRKPNYVLAIFAKKMARVPLKTESRRPNPESPARPEGQGPEDRKPKTELRFCHFRQKNGPGTSEDRKPKADPESPARGAGARRPKTELRFGHFRQKNGPGASEDRKPKAESRKPGPARGAGARRPKTENRITFLPFSPKKWSGYLRRPKAEGRIPEAWKTENREPNYVLAIFAKKMVRVPPKTESRRPNPGSLARPEGQGPEDRKPKTDLRFGHFYEK